MDSPGCPGRPHSVLIPLSQSYPQLKGRLPACYSPFRHFHRNYIAIAPDLVRLACLIHAASVRSEPGSNSPLKNVEPILAVSGSDGLLIPNQQSRFREIVELITGFRHIAPLLIRSGVSHIRLSKIKTTNYPSVAFPFFGLGSRRLQGSIKSTTKKQPEILRTRYREIVSVSIDFFKKNFSRKWPLFHDFSGVRSPSRCRAPPRIPSSPRFPRPPRAGEPSRRPPPPRTNHPASPPKRPGPRTP